ncbi:MAG: LPXTG cell wall anchor domain-containing protein [Microbacterium sp.]|uniref:LPXTG cell wall anchor domain-containing protein n=1 Tax=Microbacterium sp. TaxID=51671 RepID=UPI0039E5AE2C
MRRIIAATALSIAAVGLSSGAALAADDYTPTTSGETTLAGSGVTATCNGENPYIDYNVDLTGSSGSGHTAYLELSKGGNTSTITLGALVDGQLSGSVERPSGWAAGDVTATLYVDPADAASTSIPLSGASCGDTAVLADDPDVLATTGGTVSLVAAGAGVAALAVGAGLTLRRRRAER